MSSSCNSNHLVGWGEAYPNLNMACKHGSAGVRVRSPSLRPLLVCVNKALKKRVAQLEEKVNDQGDGHG